MIRLTHDEIVKMSEVIRDDYGSGLPSLMAENVQDYYLKGHIPLKSKYVIISMNEILSCLKIVDQKSDLHKKLTQAKKACEVTGDKVMYICRRETS